ncbi:MAG TPA: recombinase family protein [Planctomycetota bacterium]|jgi:hypothetical protein
MVSSIVHTRFSSDEQNENSTETQLQAIRDWAERNSYSIVADYIDEATTGRDDDRLNFLKMFRDLKSGTVKAQAVLVYKMSRFFRGVEYGSMYESRLERLGVKLISVTEPLPENEALAKLNKNMVRVFDEFTSDNIGKQLVAETDGPVLGNDGKPLGSGGINAILRSPIYKGVFIYNKFGYRKVMNGLGIDGGHMSKHRYRKPEREWVSVYNADWRIVSDELWEAAQKARAANQREGFGHGCKRASFLLTGKIVCGVCGNSCGGKWQKSKNSTFSENSNYFYYRCRDAMDGSDICANTTKIRGEQFEDAVVKKLLSEFLDEDFICDVAKAILAMQEQDAGGRQDASRSARRQKLIEEQGRLADLAAKAGGSIEMIAGKIRELEQERIKIDAAVPAAPAAKLDPERLKPMVRAKLKDLRGLVQDAVGMDDLRCVLKKFIDAIRIDPDGRVYIKWRERAVYDILKIEPPVSEMKLARTHQLDSGHSPNGLREWHLLSVPHRDRRPLPADGACGPEEILNLLPPPDVCSDSGARQAA